MRQLKARAFAAGVTMVAALTGGCAGDTAGQPKTGPESGPEPSDSESQPRPSTVHIDGRDYTCAQVTASEPQDCGEYTQMAFDKHKERIDTFVNSDRHGPVFNDPQMLRFEDVAFAGLVACATLLEGGDENEFIDDVLTEQPFSEMELARVEVLPVWFSAQRYLCPSQ